MAKYKMNLKEIKQKAKALHKKADGVILDNCKLLGEGELKELNEQTDSSCFIDLDLKTLRKFHNKHIKNKVLKKYWIRINEVNVLDLLGNIEFIEEENQKLEKELEGYKKIKRDLINKNANKELIISGYKQQKKEDNKSMDAMVITQKYNLNEIEKLKKDRDNQWKGASASYDKLKKHLIENTFDKKKVLDLIDKFIEKDKKLTGNINDKFRKQWVVSTLKELKQELEEKK